MIIQYTEILRKQLLHTLSTIWYSVFVENSQLAVIFTALVITNAEFVLNC